MFGHLHTGRHPEVGFGLLMVMAVLMVTEIAPAATADGIGLAVVVVFADLQLGEHLR